MRDLFDNGVSALTAFRQAIATTSHNIANVNTEGYTRQRVMLGTPAPDRTSLGWIGNGVRVEGIERITSEFATGRVFDTTASHAGESVHHAMASRVDNLLAEDALSLAPALESFFAALEDAATDPGSRATREAALAAGSELATRFRSLQGELDDNAAEVDARRAASVDTLNELAGSLAEVNRRITAHRVSGREPFSADLMDERERLVAAMAAEADVQVFEQDNGALNVSIGDGIALVTDRQAHALSVVPGDRPGDSGVAIEHGGNTLQIGARLRGGALGGLAAFTGGTLDPAQQRLGQLAQTVAAEINGAHAAGIDRRGATGGEWFTAPEPDVIASSANAGSVAPAAAVEDAQALLATDYALRFDGAAWQITRGSDGSTSTSGSGTLALDGLSFTLPAGAAAGDSFTVSATHGAARDLRAQLTDPDALALAAPVRGDTPLANTGDSVLDGPRIDDAANAALANTVELRFTASDTYDLVDVTAGTTLASGVPFASGDTVSANGWTLTVTGAPVAGDVQRVMANADGGNDNGNALALADLRRATAVGGESSFSEAFGQLAGEVGSRTRAVGVRAETLASLKSDALDRRDAISGVDIDEEAVALARHEQAYQAAAQVISTADELFQTILGAMR